MPIYLPLWDLQEDAAILLNDLWANTESESCVQGYIFEESNELGSVTQINYNLYFSL